jgi:hypothetical protein
MRTVECTDCLDDIDVETFGYHIVDEYIVCAQCIEGDN